MSEVNTDLIHEFLNKEGVSSLSKALLTKVNARIQERIVSNIDESSDANHVPSAAAVYAAINKMSHIKFKTHTGDISDITEPNASYIYLQRDNETDTSWMMYVYDSTEGWINIGDTQVNLSNYWSKSEDDIEALKLALGISDNISEEMTKFKEEIREEIKNLPASMLFNEDGDFAIYLTADKNMSLVDYMFTLEKPGMYTIYAQRGCPDNPVSEVNSSFRGICHISQLENDTPNGETGTQKLYGWIMLFDQEANTYVNYIRRSEASGWSNLNDKALIKSEIERLEQELNNKVSNDQLVKLTEEEIISAVESAYTDTMPTL